jgi:hypothetical protein
MGFKSHYVSTKTSIWPDNSAASSDLIHTSQSKACGRLAMPTIHSSLSLLPSARAVHSVCWKSRESRRNLCVCDRMCSALFLSYSHAASIYKGCYVCAARAKYIKRVGGGDKWSHASPSAASTPCVCVYKSPSHNLARNPLKFPKNVGRKFWLGASTKARAQQK